MRTNQAVAKALRNLSGAELKALRNRLGLSVAKASRQVEVSSRTWARWEAGKQPIPLGAMKLFFILNKKERPAVFVPDIPKQQRTITAYVETIEQPPQTIKTYVADH